LPDRRTHRGPDPHDASAFGPDTWPGLNAAVADLSWLLGKNYAEPSALKLVGDRYQHTARQRQAVRRAACSDLARTCRQRNRAALSDLRGRPLWIDGFNVLTTIEAALGGGVILAARDGSYRDLASVHGTYRKVEETRPALELVGKTLAGHEIGPCRWLLDSPVSNSGRLKVLILETAQANGWPWSVELVFDPDPLLFEAPEAVATADSAILDRCKAWVALSRAIVEASVPGAFVVELAGNGTE
jgi:hypothetical protein